MSKRKPVDLQKAVLKRRLFKEMKAAKSKANTVLHSTKDHTRCAKLTGCNHQESDGQTCCDPDLKRPLSSARRLSVTSNLTELRLCSIDSSSSTEGAATPASDDEVGPATAIQHTEASDSTEPPDPRGVAWSSQEQKVPEESSIETKSHRHKLQRAVSKFKFLSLWYKAKQVDKHSEPFKKSPVKDVHLDPNIGCDSSVESSQHVPSTNPQSRRSSKQDDTAPPGCLPTALTSSLSSEADRTNCGQASSSLDTEHSDSCCYNTVGLDRGLSNICCNTVGLDRGLSNSSCCNLYVDSQESVLLEWRHGAHGYPEQQKDTLNLQDTTLTSSDNPHWPLSDQSPMSEK